MTDLLGETIVRDATPLRRSVSLLGIGTASPPTLSQLDAAAVSEEFSCQSDGQRAWLRRVFSHSGVEQRGSVLKTGAGLAELRAFYGPPAEAGLRGPTTAIRMTRYAAEAPVLAERAARAALEASGVAPRRITHLITVSCTGFYAPGLDVELTGRLDLRPDVRRVHIGFMGCHAAFNALGAAKDAVTADPSARVLVCCVELSTLHFAYGWNPEKLVANALFADGASACVVGAENDENRKVHGDVPRGWRLIETASLLLPDSRDAMTWRIGDHGFEMTLSAELPALIGRHLRSWCESWLSKAGLALPDVRYWAIHPGGPKILAAAGEALGIGEPDLRASRQILAQHGNMSSATLLFLLNRLLQNRKSGDEQEAKEGGHRPCAAIGFGPGLMAEGLLLEM